MKIFLQNPVSRCVILLFLIAGHYNRDYFLFLPNLKKASRVDADSVQGEPSEPESRSLPPFLGCEILNGSSFLPIKFVPRIAETKN